MTTVTPIFPILQQTSAMMTSYADVVNQKNPQVAIPTEDIPIVVDDSRMKNRLFLMHPNLVENIDYTFSPPPPPRCPPPRCFKLQCLQDFIDKVRNKDEDDDDDDYDFDGFYYNCRDYDLDDEPLHQILPDPDDDADYDADYENEQDLDIE